MAPGVNCCPHPCLWPRRLPRKRRKNGPKVRKPKNPCKSPFARRPATRPYLSFVEAYPPRVVGEEESFPTMCWTPTDSWWKLFYAIYYVACSGEWRIYAPLPGILLSMGLSLWIIANTSSLMLYYHTNGKLRVLHIFSYLDPFVTTTSRWAVEDPGICYECFAALSR